MDPVVQKIVPKPDLHQQMVQKLKASADQDRAESEARGKPQHGITEGVASAVVHGIVTQLFKEMVTHENMEALTEIVMTQAGNVARLAVSDVGQKGSRISAQEAFTGSYDAVERKMKEKFQSPHMAFMMTAAMVYLGLLATGLLLAVWRAALL